MTVRKVNESVQEICFQILNREIIVWTKVIISAGNEEDMSPSFFKILFFVPLTFIVLCSFSYKSLWYDHVSRLKLPSEATHRLSYFIGEGCWGCSLKGIPADTIQDFNLYQ